MFSVFSASNYRSDRDLYRAIKQLKLDKDQKGIIRRFRREGKNWNSHLEHTKEFISKHIENKEYEKISIWGSGYLLDIPLKKLSKTCKKLELVDIIHPKESLKEASKYKNVEFIYDDLSGGILKELHKMCKPDISKDEQSSNFETLRNINYTPKKKSDLYISVNSLSQIPMFINDFITQHRIIADKDKKKLYSEIQKKHIDFLQDNKAILISDFEEEYYDEENNLAGVRPLLEIPIIKNQSYMEWKWDFDQSFLYKTDFTTKMNVFGMSFNL